MSVFAVHAVAADLPGAPPRAPRLVEQLTAATAAEAGRGEATRTRHRDASGAPLFTNRLILEPSPYLRQHAHNPVDWYPWGDEAFARARAEGKLVLLSVGYSTCHWCHVMEEESFEDEEIAEFLNRHYVAIKVDRERRPDVDAVYMAAVEHLTGRGGWPMTVWLTADRQPFYGGTYFPPRDGMRGVSSGFLTLLTTLDRVARQRPADMTKAAANLTARLATSLAPPAGEGTVDAVLPDRAVASWREQFDAANGGFGGAPKFPRPAVLDALWRAQRRSGDADSGRMARRTLAAMAAGGINDQVGGGFHRYATDAGWRVPHFEKMLADNAQLARAYLDGLQAGGDADDARVARQTLAYLEREMRAPDGGFYTASDADSGGGEGRYFVWTAAEIDAALPEAQRALVKQHYGVTASGNFNGRNVLFVAEPLAAVAQQLALSPDDARASLGAARERLREVRAQRPPPLTDHKVLSAWNGLAIGALARAGLVFGDAAYTASAARTARAVLDRRSAGRLPRSSLDGAASGTAVLDDYAFVVAGLLDLVEAGGDAEWLREALALQAVLDAHYADPRGGYFLTADDSEALLVRAKPAYDGAEPTGNSVAALNLLRLAALTGDDRYRVRAAALLQSYAAALRQEPTALPAMLAALDWSLDRAKQIVIVTPHDRAEAEPFLALLRRTWLPNSVLIVTSEAGRETLAGLTPLAADKTAAGGRPTAYVCERNVCALPTADPAVFARQLAAHPALQPTLQPTLSIPPAPPSGDD
ncbi:MAG: thioredoxin domain-containing protein [bacterium]